MSSEPDPIRENNQTTDSSRESDIQASHGETNVSPAPGIAPPPPTKPHCEITCKAEKHWWDKLKPFVEIIGIALLAVYTVYTIKMYSANRDAADAATSAAGAASRSAESQEQTMKLDQRPWIYVTFSPNVKVVKGQPITIPVQLANTGKPPAYNPLIEIEIYPIDKDQTPDFNYSSGHARYRLSGGSINPSVPKTYPLKAIQHDDNGKPEVILGTKELHDRVNSGDSQIIVHGRIKYCDISAYRM